MLRIFLPRYAALALACIIAGPLPARVLAGPNLVAIGHYDEAPFARAVGRDGPGGKVVFFAFDDPELDFGRVVVRSRKAASVVRRDLFVGFTGEGLVVQTRKSSGADLQIDEIEFWLRLSGAVRGGRTYEWEFEGGSDRRGRDDIEAIIPALWADGQRLGAEITIRPAVAESSDRIQRLLFPHGRVNVPLFERQTGAAWIVLKPTQFGNAFTLRRFSFRELESKSGADADTSMPVPVRYIPIRSVLEDRVAEVLLRSADALKELQQPDGHWGDSEDLEQSVAVTAAVASALAELDREGDHVHAALEWLAEQVPDSKQRWSVQTVARRLSCLSRYGGLGRYDRVIRTDTVFLTDGQSKDGGWAGRSARASGVDVEEATSSHDDSIAALMALREARFAGVDPDRGAWKRAMQYWTDARSYGGGYSHKLARYGGVGEATTSAYTASGAAALIASVDMASGMNGRRCGAFRASSKQLRTAAGALAWLEKNYGEPFRSGGSLVSDSDPFIEAERLGFLGSVSGLSQFNGKDHFSESARLLLRHYDSTTAMFGVRAEDDTFAENPSPLRTARALSVFAAGGAPTVCQRIIVGSPKERWSEFRSDVPHLVRYLAAERGRQLNWRRTTIDRPVRELVEVPILLLIFDDKPNWSKQQWRKIREYCFAGGSVVIDITDGSAETRSAVITSVRETFPEYKLAEVPSDAAIFKVGERRLDVKGMLGIGNGLRRFLFIPQESWACQWHLHQIDAHPESFAFMNNLLDYATDGVPGRSSFARSTYAVGAATSRSMSALLMQVGGSVPAHPNLLETTSRLMQSHYRVAVSAADEPDEADVVWVTVAGDAEVSAADQVRLRNALKAGTFLLVDVASGNPRWAKRFMDFLRGLDGRVVLEKMRSTDALVTGAIEGSQGFDVVRVGMRRALQKRFSKKGRCELYSIRWDGRPVGVFSAHDLSSGIGYQYFPGCRGPVPADARKLVMNVFLTAYGRKVGR
ncbi:MAG: DUF4159 domain-containing protein [Planctomycetes bacterium]|nr:DUF4159 domain-containing protein [Planctomycetota bacterium]